MKFFWIPLFTLALAASDVYAQFLTWESRYSPYAVNDAVQMDGVWYAGTKSGLVTFPATNPENLTFLSRETGLSSVNITAVAADSLSGRIILGYQNGDLQFFSPADGSFFTVSDIKMNQTYNNKQINCFMVFNERLWIGTEFGVVIFNLRTKIFETDFSRVGSLTDMRVQDILQTNGVVYLATSNGLFFTNSDAKNFKDPNIWSLVTGFPASNSTQLLKDKSGLYAVFSSGLFRLVEGTAENLAGWIPETVTSIGKLAGDSLALLSVKTERINGVEVTTRYLTKCLPDGSVAKKTNSPVLSRFAGSGESLFALSPTEGFYSVSGSSFLDLPGMPFNSIGDMTFNGQNYIATSGISWGGFSVRTSDGDRFYNSRTIAEMAGIFGFFGAQYFEGKPLVSTWGGGVIQVTGDHSVTIYNSRNSGLKGIPNYPDFVAVPDIDLDGNGDLWILNYYCTDFKPMKVKRNGQSWTNLEGFSFPGNPGNLFKKHWIDPQGNHWLEVYDSQGYPTVGLLVYSENGTAASQADDKYKLLSTKSGSGSLPSAEINDVAFDGTGAAWIATPSGLSVLYNAYYVLDQTGTVNAQPVYAIQNQAVSSVVIDVSGRKWVGLPGGLVVLSAEGDQVEAQFTTRNSGLMADQVRGLKYNPASGEIFALTDFGISVFRSSSVAPASDPETPEVFPNPFLPAEHDQVWFRGLSKESDVLIFSMNGRLIRKLSGLPSQVRSWDGLDENGKPVPTGIYVFSFRDSGKGKSTTGKVAVIR